MPLTETEQKIVENMFESIMDVWPDHKFIEGLGEVIYDMTGNVNLRVRLDNIELKLEKSG